MPNDSSALGSSLPGSLSSRPEISPDQPVKSNIRWLVCGLLFFATTINYMDRSVLSLIEPLLHDLKFMGWNSSLDSAHQTVFNNNYGDIVICFKSPTASAFSPRAGL